MIYPIQKQKVGLGLIALIALAALVLMPSTASAAKKSKKRCVVPAAATAGGTAATASSVKRASSGGFTVASLTTTGDESAEESDQPAASTPINECGPAGKARLLPNGKAIAPPDAPPRVKRAIAWANKIRSKPYVWGGGHARFFDRGYDCSGAVSFALRGGRFIKSPMASTGYMRWRAPGKGRWITTYAHGGHAYVVIAGLRFDTSMTGGNGPRWSTKMRSSRGFVARHPAGF